MGHGDQPVSPRVVCLETRQVQGQSVRRGQERCAGASRPVLILAQLAVPQPVPAFDAPAVPHQLPQGFWRGAQAGEQQVPLVGGPAGTLAADDKLEHPA